MRTALQLALAAVIVSLAPLSRAVAQDFAVVVNSDVPGSTIAASELAKAFERRAEWWSNRLPVDPVDLAEDSPVRVSFTQDIMGKTVAQMKAYWQAQIFTGRGVPPIELASDEAVLEYVRSHPGAVGYVSRDAKLPGGVRRMTVTD
jgi:ABC-type phosphate transport system substrate-binding protein